MKNLRKSILLISVMLVIMIVFTGCTTTANEESPNRATISFNEKYVTLYSPIESNIDVTVTVSYSDISSIDITKRIPIASGETKIFSVVDIDETLFTEEATITSAKIILQEYDSVALTIGLGLLFFLLAALIVWMVILAKSYVKN